MKKEIKILCTICARKGSKGLKNKNLLKLLGKPIIHHTLDQIKKIKSITKIVISVQGFIPDNNIIILFLIDDILL